MKLLIHLGLLFHVVFFGQTAHAQPIPLNRSTKQQVIERLCTTLNQNYIHADTASRMSRLLVSHLQTGHYDTIRSPTVLASRLTRDLLSVYDDDHLSIEYDPGFGLPNSADSALIRQEAVRREAFRRRVNFGFSKLEILPGNIGYLKIDGFFAPDLATKSMAGAALRLVSNSEALILDLRTNRGGDPDMVSYLCSFFFANRVHLNDLYSRKDNARRAYWTSPDTLLSQLHKLPIYLLTSRQTFSAGEELAYDLQTQHRATIVGETTGGGAHPVQPYGIGFGFVANVPFARAINPITKTDWEKVGVKPDIAVSAAQALEIVIGRINRK